MAPTPLSDPLRQLTLVHADAGFVVTVSASAGLGLRRAFVALRRATADVLWSVDLDGGRDAEILIPTSELVAASREMVMNSLGIITIVVVFCSAPTILDAQKLRSIDSRPTN